MPDQKKIQKLTYDLVIFENCFPSLSSNSSESANASTEFYSVRYARDECEVVVYKLNNSTLADKPGGRISDFKF